MRYFLFSLLDFLQEMHWTMLLDTTVSRVWMEFSLSDSACRIADHRESSRSRKCFICSLSSLVPNKFHFFQHVEKQSDWIVNWNIISFNERMIFHNHPSLKRYIWYQDKKKKSTSENNFKNWDMYSNNFLKIQRAPQNFLSQH